jgi:hypothetical protein
LGTKPVASKPFRNGTRHGASASGERLLRYPITGIGSCCARAASGQVVAAPPSTDMNCRLPMSIAIRPVPNGMGVEYHAPIGRSGSQKQTICAAVFGERAAATACTGAAVDDPTRHFAVVNCRIAKGLLDHLVSETSKPGGTSMPTDGIVPNSAIAHAEPNVRHQSLCVAPLATILVQTGNVLHTGVRACKPCLPRTPSDHIGR